MHNNKKKRNKRTVIKNVEQIKDTIRVRKEKGKEYSLRIQVQILHIESGESINLKEN